MSLGVTAGHLVDERPVSVPQIRDVAAVVPDRRPALREQQEMPVGRPLVRPAS
jgi:hypothetical protein